MKRHSTSTGNGTVAGSRREATAASPRRRQPVTRAANDNKRNPPHRQRYAWDVYRAAATARYVGQVIAADAAEAIEAAAVEFKTDVKKLIAVRRFEIA